MSLVNDFKKNLESGKYETSTGALRAIGKLTTDEDERKKMRKFVADKWPEGTPSAAKPAGAKKSAGKASAGDTAASAATGKKRGPKPKQPKSDEDEGPAKASPVGEALGTGYSTINLANIQLGTISQAISSLEAIRQAGVNVEPEMSKAKAAVGRVLESVFGAASSIEKSAATAHPVPPNGAAAPMLPGYAPSA